MKNIIKHTLYMIVTLVAAGLLSGCRDADPEFVHTDNLINQLFMMTTQQGTQYQFTITEYDANGQVVTENLTAEAVAGGYGVAKITFSYALMDDIDLTRVYLAAHVGYDVIINPGLSGVHDISGDGIVVNVKGGNGKVRKYRISGSFE